MTGRAGKLLGIDHGIKRIGVAVCDELRVSARELCIIDRRTREVDFQRINTIANEAGVVGIIVGLPTNEPLDGAYGQADTVRLWVERYSETTDLPIVLWDEQLSSEDAKDLARQHRRKPGARVDDLAARVILQSYIDALSDSLAPEI